MTGLIVTWLVLRLDDAGNVYLVQDMLDEGAANALVRTLTDRGHKQTYTAYAYADRGEREQLFARLKVIK
jgi:hypothetical protein